MGRQTTRDWRRTAGLDLEIPEGTTTDTPTYSFGRDSSSITFPSERDVHTSPHFRAGNSEPGGGPRKRCYGQRARNNQT